MRNWFYLRRHYSTLLPPTAVLRRLQQIITPRPIGWRRLFTIFRPPCAGQVQAATCTFTSRVPWGRSNGPSVHGRWQATVPSAQPLAGTSVCLIIRLPLGKVLLELFLLALLGGISFQTELFVHPTRVALLPVGLGVVFMLFYISSAAWSIRHAERYFKSALALTEIAEQ